MRLKAQTWLAAFAVLLGTGLVRAAGVGPVSAVAPVPTVAPLPAVAPGPAPAAPAAALDPNQSPALCGTSDTPETGMQGDVRPPGGVNCGLSFLSEVPGAGELPGGGSVQGSGHCAYVRNGGGGYTDADGAVVTAFDLSDPENPVQTDQEVVHGGSESMRAKTTGTRAILVSGSAVWDVSNCEDMVYKGEILWPALENTNGHAGQAGGVVASHEIAISHDAYRVYSGLGFNVAYLDDLEDPDSWEVYAHTCQLSAQVGYPPFIVQGIVDPLCEIAPGLPYAPQFSHSSDDNWEGTRWYGANQNGDGFSQLEPSTGRIVDISVKGSPVILDFLPEFPGHSLDYWKAPDGREFVLGANEAAAGDTCQPHPRPTNLGNSADGYIAEVTGDEMVHASRLSLMINEPQNCAAEDASGSNAGISEHSTYNENGAAFVMVEWGTAGLRVFDVRDGYNPVEVAYFNTSGNVHSGVFHYDHTRGIMLQSASTGMRVLELQPQVIQALGLPTPTDPEYPRYPNGRPATPTP